MCLCRCAQCSGWARWQRGAWEHLLGGGRPALGIPSRSSLRVQEDLRLCQPWEAQPCPCTWGLLTEVCTPRGCCNKSPPGWQLPTAQDLSCSSGKQRAYASAAGSASRRPQGRPSQGSRGLALPFLSLDLHSWAGGAFSTFRSAVPPLLVAVLASLPLCWVVSATAWGAHLGTQYCPHLKIPGLITLASARRLCPPPAALRTSEAGTLIKELRTSGGLLTPGPGRRGCLCPRPACCVIPRREAERPGRARRGRERPSLANPSCQRSRGPWALLARPRLPALLWGVHSQHFQACL